MQTSSIVFGVSGCLGSAIFSQLNKADPGFVTGACRKPGQHQIPFDLGNPAKWMLPDKIRYGVIAAAATSREFCENYPTESRMINVVNTLRLARAIEERGGCVLFLSTNLVFDGSRPDFMPWDSVVPLDNYGKQKTEVEEFLLSKIPSALIVRLTKVFYNNFPLFEKWRNEAVSGSSVSAFNNISVSPVSPQFIAKNAVNLLANGSTGIVHLSGNISISYYDLAHMTLRKHNLSQALVAPIDMEKSLEHGTLGIIPKASEPMVEDSILVVNSVLDAMRGNHAALL